MVTPSFTAEAAYGASKRGSEVKDDRLKALYAAQAAYAVSDGYQVATATGTSGDAGVSLRIGIGASSASRETRTHDETAYGRRFHSKGDIAIAATGGDLNIIGSQVDGTNVALAAANNINLLSQEELHSSKSTNRNGSDADPSKNLLNTGSLTWEAIHNEANYSASGVGLSGGYSSGKAGSDGTPNPFGKEGYRASPSMSIPQKGHSSSETFAGIANGTIVVRDGPVDLSGLDRTPSLDSQALKGIFDEQKIREQLELGQVAGYVGMRAAGDVANYMANHASSEKERAAWSDGGANKMLLHGLVGAGTAALGGGNALDGLKGAAASQAATLAMQQYLTSQGVEPNSPAFNSMMEMASAAIGAAAGGGAGATTALNGDRYNRQLHPDERVLAKELAAKSDGRFTVEQIEDAMRMSGNSALRETALTGFLVDINQSNEIYDTVGAKWMLVASPDGNTKY
jgi:hypothetical protein